jgi:hypothetical protein
MWKKFIGYGSYHYRYASGREANWFPIGLTDNKQYVSLDICATDDDGYLAEQIAERLGKVNVRGGPLCDVAVRRPRPARGR